MEVELHLLSPLASAAAWPAGMGYWAGLVIVEPADMEPQAGSLAVWVADTEPQAGSLAVLVADTEPQAGSLAVLVADKEPQADSLAVLVADKEQLVSAAFAGRPGAFLEEHLASGIVVSGPMDPGPMGLWLVYKLLRWRVRVIPQSVEPLGEVGSN